MLTEDNKILSYMNDSSKDVDFFKSIILEKAKSIKLDFGKNDGTIMPILSYEIIKQIFDVSLLYLMSYDDIESAKKGYDSIFFSHNSVFVVEYKTSINTANARNIIEFIEEGIESLFFKKSKVISSLFYCKNECQKIINPEERDRIKRSIEYLLDNKNNSGMLIANEEIEYNVCVVSPLNINIEDVDEEIRNNFLICNDCPSKKQKCRKEKCCKYSKNKEKIKIVNFIHLKIENDFSLPKLYNALLKLWGI